MKKKLIIIISFLVLILALIFIIKNLLWEKNNKTKEIKQENNYICDHCNILLMDIDIFRGDELSCFGYPRETTPNLCNFAKKSLVFKNNFSASFFTLPSMFSTVTSLYPIFHRVRTVTVDKLDNKIPTLAETLKNNGYYTVFLGPDSKNSTFLSSENNGLKGYDLVIDTNEVMDVIKKLPKDKPWFIHSYYGDLHMPYFVSNKENILDKTMIAPKKFPITLEDSYKELNIYIKNHMNDIFTVKGIEKYKNTKNLGIELYKLGGTKDEMKYLKNFWDPIFTSYIESFDKKNKSDVEYVRMMYDSNIRILDDKLKQLYETFSSKTDTITVMMSDHGENFGEHGYFCHASDFHHSLFHTPLMIFSPKITAKEIEETTSNIDIFPTLLDMVGISQIKNLQGKSLLKENGNKKIDSDNFSIGECATGIAMYNANWTYYVPWDSHDKTGAMLFDIKKDPEELNNVIDQHPELIKSLSKKSNLLLYYENLSQNTITSNYSIPIELSPEKIEKLKKQEYF